MKWIDEKLDIRYVTLDISDDLVNRLIKDIKSTGDKTYQSSNLQCDMTDWKTMLSSFDELENIISKQIVEDCTFKDHWGAVYRDGDYAKPHDHGESDISFVFYLDAPEGSGEIYFNQIDVSVKPKNKMLMLFPGTVIHEVWPNTTSGIERIITAGNVDFSVDNV
ncbi:MAG: 2OG-Fe(II) oxygenase family protein [Crocinitomicaceae bacterium]|nr:2OG-Fe(II) oxygenase family protein [Crocinitomicaceae bacterium]